MADMEDIFKNFSSMMNGKEIPDNIKEALGSFMNSNTLSNSDVSTGTSSYNSSEKNSENSSNSVNSDNSNGSKNSSTSANSAGSDFNMPNFDINTMLKMQKIMSAMNGQKNDSGATLLRSLKPYLKPSRRAKVDEYIQLLSLEKVMELMNNSGGDKNHGA